MPFSNSLVSSGYHTMGHLFQSHLRSHYFPMDSVKQVNSLAEVPTTADQLRSPRLKARFWLKIQYLLPFVSLLLLNVDSLYVLSLYGWRYNATGMPELFTHKVFPFVLWPQADGEMFMGIETEQIIYGLFLFTAVMPPRCITYLVKGSSSSRVSNSPTSNSQMLFQNGKRLPAVFEQPLLKFYLKTHKFARIFMFIVWAELFLYWYICLWLKDSHTLRDLILKLYVPFFSVYSASGVCFIPFYFILNVHYLLIKQRLLIRQAEGNLEELMAINSGSSSNDNVNKAAKLAAVRRRFASTFTTMLALFDELQAMDHFWQPYVTVDFLGYIGMECYLIHGFLVDPSSLELGQRSFFLFFAVEILAIILLLTGECSLVVACSERYYRLNRKFVHELRNQRGEKSKAISLATMLKV